MRLTKIKKQKDGGMEIRFRETLGKGERESVFKCPEDQHPDLDTAFAVLEQDVRNILELNELLVWPAAITIRSVSFSFSEETDVQGAVISGTVQLESGATFCFNTPHLPFEQYSATGESALMPQRTIMKLALLTNEALAYMDGSKRAQMQLSGV